MGNISLLIVSDDREYGRVLGQAILHICTQILIQLMSKEEFFLMRRRSGRQRDGSCFVDTADLILWDGEEAESVYGGRIVLLSEKPEMAVKKISEKRFCIYKYSTAQSVVSEIFEIYSVLTGKRAAHIKGRSVRLLAFSSCSGGTGCTTLAMAAAQELCRFRNQRVLYLSFEEVESTGEFMESPVGVKGAGVYLYHLFKPGSLRIAEETGEYPLMEGYIVRDSFGVEAFAPTAGRNPLKSLTEEEFTVFMASVIDSGRYDAVVMDLGSGISKTELSCMEISEKVCFISGKSASREIQYLQYLICRCGEGIVEKLVKTENMAALSEKEEKGQVGQAPMIETAVKIAESDDFLQTGEVKRIFLDGSFGSSIKLLTEKLTEPT